MAIGQSCDPRCVDGYCVLTNSTACRLSDAALNVRAIDAQIKKLGITYTSFEVFMAYAKDAGNWSGTPLVGGNVGGGPQERGNLTQLKIAGLIQTIDGERQTKYVEFTAKGREFAAQMGIVID